MGRSSPILVLAVVAVGLLAMSSLFSPAYVQPPAESRRQAILGGLAAASLAAAPANAGTKFSVFGLGSEQSKSMSDPYNKNDVDAYSPYSEYSNILNKDENLYKPYNDYAMNKRRNYIKESEQRLIKTIPGALAAANKEEVRMESTRQVYMMRDSMSYLADAAKGKGDYEPDRIKKIFFDEIGDMLVFAKLGRFTESKQKYDSMMNTLSEFKSVEGGF